MKKWRTTLSRVMTLAVAAAFVYWGYRYRATVGQLFRGLQPLELAGLGGTLSLAVMLSANGFTVLVRGIGYRFTHRDGYHSLNLSQVAAMVPGKIWGFAGLLGLLWSRGISRPDGVLIIFLHTLLSLSAAVLVGFVGLVAVLGWGYGLLGLLPLFLLLIGRPYWEALRLRFCDGSSAFPSHKTLLIVLAVGLGSWGLVCASFTYLLYGIARPATMTPWLAASAFAAGYIGGFVNPITPAGLGVREGIITAILGPTLGSEQVLTVAIIFRALHMLVLWLHIGITLSVLWFGARPASRDIEQIS